MKMGKIKTVILNVRGIIERKWKRSKKELCGWIIDEHVIWLDSSFSNSKEIFLSDKVSEIFSTIDSISFHTHPFEDESGKESISITDRIYACSYGPEIVFTYKGIYIIKPLIKEPFNKLSETEDYIIEKSEEESCGNNDKLLKLYMEYGKKAFPCRIYRIGDLNVFNR